MIQLINDEKFTNIQKAQAGLTKLFLKARKSLSFYRVMKNDVPLGVLIPEEMWQSWTEDIEALSSPKFRQKIAKARSEKKRISADKIRRMVNR
jgi:PHD/YefM family antitoxin component YafN of YafNO toxin-antitoxin module